MHALLCRGRRPAASERSPQAAAAAPVTDGGSEGPSTSESEQPMQRSAPNHSGDMGGNGNEGARRPPTRSSALPLEAGLGRNGKPKGALVTLGASRAVKAAPPQQHLHKPPVSTSAADSDTTSSRSDATTDGKQLRNGKLRSTAHAEAGEARPHQHPPRLHPGPAAGADRAPGADDKALKQLNGRHAQRLPPEQHSRKLVRSLLAKRPVASGEAKRKGAAKPRRAPGMLYSESYELPRTRRHV